MFKMKVQLLSLLIVVLSTLSQSTMADIAGINVPKDEYSIFERKGGTVEIRLKNIRSNYTGIPLSCNDNNIISVGNSNDANFNDTLMATLLTAWSTKADIQLLLSDDPADEDTFDNCGILLLHMRCAGCPSGL